ncbi:hypothetical protein [Chryseobacterium defluvii]|uniref:TonB-like protein n=1 Tax=Chryseobacterium defluvii TaxID=160396 RepID=A0A495SA02_9FLAO|nr:hypothetical protein [Chryseobacterium defluvii]RKS96733.1 hypothetical protein BCF58_3167 [Chryseobacterium defluvii]
MIKNLFLLILFVSFNTLQAQQEVLERYPYGQSPYEGGTDALILEMIQVIKKNEFSPCPSTEKYMLPILVNADASINFVKDPDTVSVFKNKCAFEFSRKLISYLKKWKPAVENGKPVGAIAEIQIEPFYLYYSKENPKLNEYKKPKFKNGMKVFGGHVKNIIEKNLSTNEDKKLYLSFVVSEKGVAENFQIDGNYTAAEKANMANELKKIKGEWEPATFNGIPMKFKFYNEFNQEFSFDYERSKYENAGW